MSYCFECGITANVLTCLKRFGEPPKQLSYTISTVHKSKCDICGKTKNVTEARDFFHPEVDLIDKVARFLQND